MRPQGEVEDTRGTKAMSEDNKDAEGAQDKSEVTRCDKGKRGGDEGRELRSEPIRGQCNRHTIRRTAKEVERSFAKMARDGKARHSNKPPCQLKLGYTR